MNKLALQGHHVTAASTGKHRLVQLPTWCGNSVENTLQISLSWARTSAREPCAPKLYYLRRVSGRNADIKSRSATWQTIGVIVFKENSTLPRRKSIISLSRVYCTITHAMPPIVSVSPTYSRVNDSRRQRSVSRIVCTRASRRECNDREKLL